MSAESQGSRVHEDGMPGVDIGRRGSSLESIATQDDPDEQQSRIKMCVSCVASCVVIIVATVLFFIFILPKILDVMTDIGDELKKERSSIGRIVLCALLSMVVAAVPVPIRAAWNYLVCFVYGWGGFPLIWLGHCLGSLLAFVVARHLWPYLEPRLLAPCVCCIRRRSGRLRKPCRFLLACVEEIESKPMQTIFLLTLTPCPASLIAYTIGAKCARTTWWEFYIAITIPGFKLLVHAYLGVTTKDLNTLVSGSERNTVDIVFTVCSCILLLVVVAGISKLAMRRLQGGTIRRDL